MKKKKKKNKNYTNNPIYHNSRKWSITLLLKYNIRLQTY